MYARVREWDLFYRVELVLAVIFMSNWFSASNREKMYRPITSGNSRHDLSDSGRQAVEISFCQLFSFASCMTLHANNVFSYVVEQAIEFIFVYKW
jgi:hypothetical protein